MEVPPHRDHHRVEDYGSKYRGIGRRHYFRIAGGHHAAGKTDLPSANTIWPASGHVMTRHACRSDRRVVVFIGGANLVAASAAKL
jgi:hypothetical protein